MIDLKYLFLIQVMAMVGLGVAILVPVNNGIKAIWRKSPSRVIVMVVMLVVLANSIWKVRVYTLNLQEKISAITYNYDNLDRKYDKLSTDYCRSVEAERVCGVQKKKDDKIIEALNDKIRGLEEQLTGMSDCDNSPYQGDRNFSNI
jgi:hypothetical protein